MVSGTKTTRQKIIEGAIQQIGEVGWAKASTKSIAAVAGVNELTLFRLFGSKPKLLEAALAETIGPVVQQLANATPVDLQTDLSALVKIYSQLVGSHPAFVMHVLAEINNPDIGELIVPLQKQVLASLRSVFVRYQHELAEIPLDAIAMAFMGPLLARSFFQHLNLTATIAPETYVQTFLQGYSKHA